jgi:hypothetical protein
MPVLQPRLLQKKDSVAICGVDESIAIPRSAAALLLTRPIAAYSIIGAKMNARMVK